MINSFLIFALISNGFEIFASSYVLYKSIIFNYKIFTEKKISERESQILLFISFIIIFVLLFRYFIFPAFIISDYFAYVYLTFNIYGTLGMLTLKNTQESPYSLLRNVSPLILFILIVSIFNPSFLMVSPIVFLTRIFIYKLIDELCKKIEWIKKYLPHEYIPEYQDHPLLLKSIEAITFASYVVTGTLSIPAIPFTIKIIMEAKNKK